MFGPKPVGAGSRHRNCSRLMPVLPLLVKSIETFHNLDAFGGETDYIQNPVLTCQ